MLLHWSELENGVLSTVKQKYAGDILKHLRSSEISTHNFHEKNTKLNGGRIKYRQVCNVPRNQPDHVTNPIKFSVIITTLL